MINEAINNILSINKRLILKSKVISEDRLTKIMEGSEMTLKEATLISRAIGVELISLAEASLGTNVGFLAFKKCYVSVDELMDDNQDDIILDLIRNHTIHLNGNRVQNEIFHNNYLSKEEEKRFYTYMLTHNLNYGLRVLAKPDLCLYDSLNDMKDLSDEQKDFYLYGYVNDRILGAPANMVSQINHFNEADRQVVVNHYIDLLSHMHQGIIELAKSTSKKPRVSMEDHIYHVLLIPKVIYFDPHMVDELNVSEELKSRLFNEMDSLANDMDELSKGDE